MSESPHPASAARIVPGTASWGRRIAALLLDGIAGSLFIIAVFGPDAYNRETWAPLAVFFVQSSLGVALTGASFGQYVLRLRVRHLDGRPLTLFRALWRQALICLVIPPLVFRQDGRGLHDILNDSAVFPARPGD